MKKNLITILLICILLMSISLGVVSTSYASEFSKVFTYQDESAVSVFTLKDETSYECKATNTESGDTIDLTGTYVKQGNRIIFYIAGEVFLEAEVGENNTLVVVDSELADDNLLTSEDEEINEVEDYTAQIVEYIIAGVLGLLGTGVTALAFRKHLKSLINSISTALGLIKQNKDSAEEDIKNVIKEAENTIASLKNIKTDIKDENRKEFEMMQKQISLLIQIISYMSSGMKELVANGTAESVYNLLKEPITEVKDNANEEI